MLKKPLLAAPPLLMACASEPESEPMSLQEAQRIQQSACHEVAHAALAQLPGPEGEDAHAYARAMDLWSVTGNHCPQGGTHCQYKFATYLPDWTGMPKSVMDAPPVQRGVFQEWYGQYRYLELPHQMTGELRFRPHGVNWVVEAYCFGDLSEVDGVAG